MSDPSDEPPEDRIDRLTKLTDLARDALVDAVHALNTASRFPVATPGGCEDSYQVASKIDRALIELGGDLNRTPWLKTARP